MFKLEEEQGGRGEGRKRQEKEMKEEMKIKLVNKEGKGLKGGQ